MKTTIAAALIATVPVMSLAQETESPFGTIMDVQVKGYCATNGLGYLNERNAVYGETPLFYARGVSILVVDDNSTVDSPGTLVVLSNQSTGTMSVAMLYDDGVACEILTGVDFTPYIQ
jgi:hypothetical protein